MTTPQTFVATQGEDVQITLPIVDSAGNPVSLSGGSAKFAMARKKGESALIGTESSPATATADLGSPETSIVIGIADTVTDDLLGTYAWECWGIDSDGDKVEVAYGYLTFRASTVF